VFFSGISTQGETTILPRFYCAALFASLYPMFQNVDQPKTLCFGRRLRVAYLTTIHISDDFIPQTELGIFLFQISLHVA